MQSCAFRERLLSGNGRTTGRTRYIDCSDEYGVIEDKGGVLLVNEKLKLIPGHCDPTCNLHDWYVGTRNGKVEVVWPVSARGMSY